MKREIPVVSILWLHFSIYSNVKLDYELFTPFKKEVKKEVKEEEEDNEKEKEKNDEGEDEGAPKLEELEILECQGGRSKDTNSE